MTDETAGGAAFVSSGHLPRPDQVQRVLEESYRRSLADRSGSVSEVYPALSHADPDAFGVCVADVDGERYESGQATSLFTLMSVAKPFVFALVCEQVGLPAVRRMVGVNATGMAFNSLQPVDQSPSGRTNPMVNPGAIATTSMVLGASATARWEVVLDGLSRFAGRELALDEATLESARATNHRNRALANLLKSKDALTGDPIDAVELYTRQSCVAVSAADLAVMGATLADGGLHPVTRRRVVDAGTAHAALAVMTIAGMYETSGEWLLDVGMPGKSGISGALVCVSPGKGALGAFSPRVDGVGNSVRGQLVAKDLARRLGMDLLASAPSVGESARPDNGNR